MQREEHWYAWSKSVVENDLFGILNANKYMYLCILCASPRHSNAKKKERKKVWEEIFLWPVEIMWWNLNIVFTQAQNIFRLLLLYLRISFQLWITRHADDDDDDYNDNKKYKCFTETEKERDMFNRTCVTSFILVKMCVVIIILHWQFCNNIATITTSPYRITDKSRQIWKKVTWNGQGIYKIEHHMFTW